MVDLVSNSPFIAFLIAFPSTIYTDTNNIEGNLWFDTTFVTIALIASVVYDGTHIFEAK